MMKKTEVIAALEDGGSIMIDTIYRRACVLDANRDEIGTCRYDTAERIERSEGYKTRRTDWYATRFVEKDWDAVSARVMAAVTKTFQALERSGYISDLEIEPITAAKETETTNNNTEEENNMNYVVYPKIYTYTEGRHYEETRSAAQAMQWHREGKRITVWGVNPEDESQYHVSIRGAAQEPARTAEDENRDTCRRIAQEIDAYADGGVYRCPDCGETLLLPDDVGDKYRCPHCEAVNDVDDLEQLSLWDYLTDVLDVEYTCGSDREYRSVRVMVACGGPNIYLNSATRDVELYWWNERARYPMHYDTAEALDEWAKEYWNM